MCSHITVTKAKTKITLTSLFLSFALKLHNFVNFYDKISFRVCFYHCIHPNVVRNKKIRTSRRHRKSDFIEFNDLTLNKMLTRTNSIKLDVLLFLFMAVKNKRKYWARRNEMNERLSKNKEKKKHFCSLVFSYFYCKDWISKQSMLNYMQLFISTTPSSNKLIADSLRCVRLLLWEVDAAFALVLFHSKLKNSHTKFRRYCLLFSACCLH